MNTTMADGASERLDAQIADALFGQPGMSKLDVANRLRELRGNGGALLGSAAYPAVWMWPHPEDGSVRFTCDGDVATEAASMGRAVSALYRVPVQEGCQPSPAGQGDALLEQVARFLDYSVGHDPWPNIRRVYGDAWWEPVRKMRDDLRALATRQPVGQEPVAPKKMARAVALDLMHAVYEHHGWNRAEGESMTARVHALYDVTLDAGRNRFVATPKPAASTAQVMDLKQFRPAVFAMGLYTEEPEGADKAEHLLVLIDSKGVQL